MCKGNWISRPSVTLYTKIHLTHNVQVKTPKKTKKKRNDWKKRNWKKKKEINFDAIYKLSQPCRRAFISVVFLFFNLDSYFRMQTDHILSTFPTFPCGCGCWRKKKKEITVVSAKTKPIFFFWRPMHFAISFHNFHLFFSFLVLFCFVLTWFLIHSLYIVVDTIDYGLWI